LLIELKQPWLLLVLTSTGTILPAAAAFSP